MEQAVHQHPMFKIPARSARPLDSALLLFSTYDHSYQTHPAFSVTYKIGSSEDGRWTIEVWKGFK